MISFVYFDLGGTVIEDFSGTNKWEEFKRELSVTSQTDRAFEDFWEKYEPEVSVGRDVESLIPLLKDQLGLPVPEGYSLLNAFVSRFEKNQSIWPVLKFVKDRCRLGLLTNMYPGMLAAIKHKGIMPDIAWDVVIDSSVVGAGKPGQKIFEIAQEKSGASHEEILFVDNSQGNTEAAKSFGWETFLYESTNLKFGSDQLLVYLSDKLGALKDHAGN